MARATRTVRLRGVSKPPSRGLARFGIALRLQGRGAAIARSVDPGLEVIQLGLKRRHLLGSRVDGSLQSLLRLLAEVPEGLLAEGVGKLSRITP
jgi:hypothetical protein